MGLSSDESKVLGIERWHRKSAQHRRNRVPSSRVVWVAFESGFRSIINASRLSGLPSFIALDAHARAAAAVV